MNHTDKMNYFYKNIIKEIEQGNYAKAKQLSDNISGDIQRYNTIGVILFCEKKIRKSIGIFSKSFEDGTNKFESAIQLFKSSF